MDRERKEKIKTNLEELAKFAFLPGYSFYYLRREHEKAGLNINSSGAYLGAFAVEGLKTAVYISLWNKL